METARAEGETDALGLNLSLEMGPSPSAAPPPPPRWASVKGEACDRATPGDAPLSPGGPPPHSGPPPLHSPGGQLPTLPSPLASPPGAGSEPYPLSSPERRARRRKQQPEEAQAGGRGPHEGQAAEHQDEGQEAGEQPGLPSEAPGLGPDTGLEPQPLGGQQQEDFAAHGGPGQGEEWGLSPPPPLGGAKRASPAADNEGLNSSRKVLKADREKLRRDKLNEQFLELAGVLDPDRPKNDKATILGDSLTVLHELRGVVGALRAENRTLREEAKELAQEKMELKAEGATLRSDIGALEAQVQERNPRGPLLPVPPWYAAAAPDRGGVVPGGFAAPATAPAPAQGPGFDAAAMHDQGPAGLDPRERAGGAQGQQGGAQERGGADASHLLSNSQPQAQSQSRSQSQSQWSTDGLQFQVRGQEVRPTSDGLGEGAPRAWQHTGQPSMLPMLVQGPLERGGEPLAEAGQGLQEHAMASEQQQQQQQGQQQQQQGGQEEEAGAAGDHWASLQQGAPAAGPAEARSQAQAALQPQFAVPHHSEHLQHAQQPHAMQMFPFFAPPPSVPATAAALPGAHKDHMPSGQPLWTQQLLPCPAVAGEHGAAKAAANQQQPSATVVQGGTGTGPALLPAGGAAEARVSAAPGDAAGRGGGATSGANRMQGMQGAVAVQGPAAGLASGGSPGAIPGLGMAGIVAGPGGAVIPSPFLYSFPVHGAMPHVAQSGPLPRAGLLPGAIAPGQLVLATPQGGFALHPMATLGTAAGAGGGGAQPASSDDGRGTRGQGQVGEGAQERSHGGQRGAQERSHGGQRGEPTQGFGTGSSPAFGAGSSSGAASLQTGAGQTVGPLLMAQPFARLPSSVPGQMAMVPHYLGLGLVAFPHPHLCENPPQATSAGPPAGPLLFSQPFLAFPPGHEGAAMPHYAPGLALGAPSVYPGSAMQSPLLFTSQLPPSQGAAGAAAQAQGPAGGTPGQAQAQAQGGVGSAPGPPDVAALPFMFGPGGAVGVHPGMLAAGLGAAGPFWSLPGASAGAAGHAGFGGRPGVTRPEVGSAPPTLAHP